MKHSDQFQLLCLSNLRIEKGLRQVQSDYDVDLGKVTNEDIDIAEKLLEFRQSLREEAKRMAQFYSVFYCLENSIREFIKGIMDEKVGASWWDHKVPQVVKDSAKKNQSREEDQGVSVRSDEIIDYTTFGELSIIIDANWDQFSDVLRNKNAVKRIFSSINQIRSPIAHCNVLADDEVSRLMTTLKDWERQQV